MSDACRSAAGALGDVQVRHLKLSPATCPRQSQSASRLACYNRAIGPAWLTVAIARSVRIWEHQATRCFWRNLGFCHFGFVSLAYLANDASREGNLSRRLSDLTILHTVQRGRGHTLPAHRLGICTAFRELRYSNLHPPISLSQTSGRVLDSEDQSCQPVRARLHRRFCCRGGYSNSPIPGHEQGNNGHCPHVGNHTARIGHYSLLNFADTFSSPFFCLY